MGEGYSPEDDEDMAFATVEKVSLPRGRYETEVSMGKAGSWVLLDGVDANILKTATKLRCVGRTADVVPLRPVSNNVRRCQDQLWPVQSLHH